MKNSETPVIVKPFPDRPSSADCRLFLRELAEVLAESYRPQVIFDLSRIQRLNAAGIELLLKCVTQVAKRDGELKLCAPSPETALVLELTQIDSLLPIFDSLDQAIASCAMHATPQLAPEPLPNAA